MNKDGSDLIIAEQNKSTEEILKAVAKVKSDYHELCKLKDMRIAELEKENAELKKQLEMSNKVYNDNLDYSHHIEDQLTKATDLLKKMYYLYFDPCVTHKDLENRDKLFEEIKQLIKEIEK